MTTKLNQCLALALIIAFAPLARGQILETLHSFQGFDGSHPSGRLTLGHDGNFYGTTVTYEPIYENAFIQTGTFFQITTNGALTTLFASRDFGNFQLIQGSNGDFYGANSSGLYGSIFKLTTNGVITTLAEFDGTNGAYPNFEMTLGTDGNFYGTTQRGGTYDEGTVFKMTPDGVLTPLVSITGVPVNGLVQGRDGNFYGVTSFFTGYGTIFRVTTNGVFTTLAAFNGRNGNIPSGLVQGNDGNLYGTTLYGGVTDSGMVFRMTPHGRLNRLVSFNGKNGEHPIAPLLQASDGNFYGATYGVLTNPVGTVFKTTPTGVLTTLVAFNGTNGAGPSELIQGNDGHLYGTTYAGGSNDLGTVFRIVYPPLFSGLYNGLFHEESGVAENSAGFFTVKIAASMKFSGKIYLDGFRYPLIGRFESNSFSTHIIVERRNLPALNLDFQLVATNGNFQLLGTVSDGNWNASLTGDRAFYSRTAPCLKKGSYAVTFLGIENSNTGPNYGSGGIADVSADGRIRFRGRLGDDTRIAQSTYISREGQWPLYVPLYPRHRQYKGLLMGWTAFIDLPGTQLDGSLAWLKTAASGRYYPTGFTNVMTVFGSVRQ